MTRMHPSHKTILLSHGGGGKHTRDLIANYFLPAFSNPHLNSLGDSAIIKINGSHIAFTTDTFVVKPLFFPGGDIGKLAVFGTVNDLTVVGARPLYISAGFVMEEGLPLEILDKVISSMKSAAESAEVQIVTGDTKVVERGGADMLFINTSGIGFYMEKKLSAESITPGDKIIINGTLGDHGIAVLSAREDLRLESEISSDCAPLNRLILPILEKFPGKIKFMRDLTRGGFATALNEICERKEFGIEVFEKNIPIREDVNAVCEILGFDPLYIANEGKAAFIVSKETANEILDFMRGQIYGENSALVGEITDEHKGKVVLKTNIGGGRILDMLIGDQLPRIC